MHMGLVVYDRCGIGLLRDYGCSGRGLFLGGYTARLGVRGDILSNPLAETGAMMGHLEFLHQHYSWPVLRVMQAAYLIGGVTGIVPYIAQIRTLIKDRSNAASFSVGMWAFWILDVSVGLAYAVLVAKNATMIAMISLSWLGCVCVTMVALARKKTWRYKPWARTRYGGGGGEGVKVAL